MSYDLFFRRRKGQFSKSQFFDYLASQEHYECFDTGAYYQNQHTGVEFSLDLAPEDDEEIDYHVECCIAYGVPEFFILEIGDQLESLAQALDLLIWDPQQEDDPLYRPFQKLALLEGWKIYNRVAVKNLAGSGGSDRLYTYPGAKLTQIWRWNYQRPDFQKEAGNDVFVPQIMMATDGTRVGTAATWSNGIPTYLPRTDLVLLVYLNLPLPPQADRERPIVIVSGESVWQLLADVPRKERIFPYLEMPTTMPDQRVIDFFSDPPALEPSWEGISFDSVVDEEYFSEI